MVIKKMVLLGAIMLFILPQQIFATPGLKLDVRAGNYTKDSNFFIGGGVNINFIMVELVPNIEYVFVDDLTMYTMNLDANVGIFTMPFIKGYIGGGYARVYTKPKDMDSSSNTGFNLLVGVKLNAIVLKPYIQIKRVFVSDCDDQTVLGIGLNF